jgi:hypothetical protein
LKFHSNPEVEEIQFELYDLGDPVNVTITIMNSTVLTRGEDDVVVGRYTFSPVSRVSAESQYFVMLCNKQAVWPKLINI